VDALAKPTPASAPLPPRPDPGGDATWELLALIGKPRSGAYAALPKGQRTLGDFGFIPATLPAAP